MSKVSNEQQNMMKHLQDNLGIEETKNVYSIFQQYIYLNSEGYQHTFSCWK